VYVPGGKNEMMLHGSAKGGESELVGSTHEES